jgi:hypothetical protein
MVFDGGPTSGGCHVEQPRVELDELVAVHRFPCVRSPFASIDDAAGVEAGPDQRHRRPGYPLDLFDEVDGVGVELVVAAGVLVVFVKVVRKCQRDVGCAVELRGAFEELPIELGDARLLSLTDPRSAFRKSSSGMPDRSAMTSQSISRVMGPEVAPVEELPTRIG